LKKSLTISPFLGLLTNIDENFDPFPHFQASWQIFYVFFYAPGNLSNLLPGRCGTVNLQNTIGCCQLLLDSFYFNKTTNFSKYLTHYHCNVNNASTGKPPKRKRLAIFW